MSERLALLLLLLAPLPPAAGQTLRATTSLVLVPVSVTDQRGATVNGLDRTNFTVFEDKLPQRIVAFSAEDAPCSVGLILDASGSMQDRLAAAKAALRAFLANANLEDEAFLLTVSSYPQVSSGFTRDLGTLAGVLPFTQASGSTALIDTIFAGLGRMQSATHSRRALLIISDGMDNHSRHSRTELLRFVMEADVPIYTIAVDAHVRSKKAIELTEERRGLALLQDLSERTGGLHFVISDGGDADRVVAQAVLALRNQYVLAYHPVERDLPGKWHSIYVKLNVAHTNVSARSGYYSR